MSSITIIHATSDAAIGDKIANALLLEGHSVRRVASGVSYEVTKANPAVVVWSQGATSEPFVLDLASAALQQDALIPVSVAGAPAPPGFERLPPIDLTGWAGDVGDPRWRFVIDEIGLAVQRDLLKDCEVWPEEPADDQTDNQTGAPAAAIVEQEEAPLTADAGRWFPVPKDNGQVQGELFVNWSDDTDDDDAELAGAARRAGGIAPRHVLVGGAGLLIAASAGAVILGPLVLGGPEPTNVDPAIVVEEIPVVEISTPATGAEAEPSANAPVQEAPPSLKELKDAPDIIELAAPLDEENADPDTDETISLALAEIAPSIKPPSPAQEPVQPEKAEIELALASPSEEAGAETPYVGEGIGEGDISIDDDAPVSGENDPLAEQILTTEGIAAAEAAELPTEQLAALVAVVGVDTNADPDIVESSNLGNYFRDCVDCPDMAALSAGEFMMGAPRGEKALHPSETPQVNVRLARPYAISTREVTFKQWDACVADGGCRSYRPADGGWGREDQPVINVSFEDAQAFTAWLSAKTGQNYRLPSEAEWEYAARGGTTTPFSFGDGVSAEIANFNGEYIYNGPKGPNRARTMPVASFAPNAFGLFDMHGNVWEWTADCWAPTHEGAPADGSVRLGDCSARVLKGGAYNTGGWRLRSAHRISKRVGAREPDNGFRVARDL